MSNVRSMPLDNGQPAASTSARRPASSSQVVAIVIWLLGAATTYQVVELLWDGGVWYGILGAAFGAQGLLTWLEGPTLRGKPNPISLLFLGIDSLINAGGVYLLLDNRLERLPTAQMAADVIGSAPQFSPLAVAAVSLIAGVILAATPEAVWRWKS